MSVFCARFTQSVSESSKQQEKCRVTVMFRLKNRNVYNNASRTNNAVCVKELAMQNGIDKQKIIDSSNCFVYNSRNEEQRAYSFSLI